MPIVDQKFIPDIHSFFDLIHNEKIRLARKGWQIFIGLGLAIFYFCCLPTLLYPAYSLIASFDPLMVIVVGTTFIGASTHTIFNLVMNHIYASKYPYFEQYRIMKKPWPWEADEKAYKKQYREIVINTAIGSLIIGPITIWLPPYLNLVEYVVDLEQYPSSYEIFKDLMFMSVVFETYYYWSHRLFHTP